MGSLRLRGWGRGEGEGGWGGAKEVVIFVDFKSWVGGGRERGRRAGAGTRRCSLHVLSSSAHEKVNTL